MLLCILTLSACGGSDEPDISDAYKGIAVDQSEIVGHTLAFSSTGTTIHKLTFVDGKNYTYKVTSVKYPSQNKDEKGTYSLTKNKGYSLLKMTKSTGSAAIFDNGRMYYKDYDKEKTAIFINSTMLVFFDD